MKRFVYSPKVWVYVNVGGPTESTKNPPDVIDLTGYVTSGGVNRLINAASTSEITIRNPYRKWTQPGKPTFRPMDTITIFMMRRKGFPIQVFTGYLDRTPYYAMYPGTVTLMATCTLKKLLYTYFDPALPYTFAFLAKYGWVPGGGGNIINPFMEAQTANTTTTTSTGLSWPLATQAKITQGPNTQGGTHDPTDAPDNWQSDNAVDIAIPRGTDVRAVSDGTITKLGGSWSGGSGNPDGFNVTLKTSNNTWFYTHLQSRESLRVGEKVKQGQLLGESGAANGVDHLHIGCETGNPEELLAENNLRATTTAPTATAKDKKVFVIGDSLGVGAKEALTKALSGFKVDQDVKESRPTSEGVKILKSRGSDLPGTIVIGLGTNDDPGNTTAFRSLVRDAMEVAGSKRQVIWINLYGSNAGSSLKPLNQVLNEESRKFPNLTIMNWNKQVSDQNIKMSGVHAADEEGYEKRANAIASLVKGGAAQAGDAAASTIDVINDSGFGKLLYATLTEIGDWKDNQIFIEKLPEGIADKVGAIFRQFDGDNAKAVEDYSTLLAGLIGTSSQGSGATTGTDSDTQALVNGPVAKQIFFYFKGRGFTDEQAAGWVGNFVQESGLDPAKHQLGGGPGRGLAQWEQGGGRFEALQKFANARGKKWEDLQTQLDFVWFELQGTENVAYKKIKAAKTVHAAAYAVVRWYERAGIVGDRNGPADAAFKEFAGTKAPLSGEVTGGGPNGDGTAGPDTTETVTPTAGLPTPDAGGKASLAKTPKEIIDNIVLKIANEKGVKRTVAQNDAGNASHSPLTADNNPSDHKGPATRAWAADMSNGSSPTPEMEALCAALNKFFGPFENNGVGTYVRVVKDGYSYQLLWKVEGHFDHVHFGVQRKDPNAKGVSYDGLPVDAASDSAADSPGGLENTRAAAFAAVLNWPSISEMSESIMLQGQKSLMNDKALLPFIEQLAGASLRSFQSLPNGTFFAFYPDYFGEMGHRNPYWEIDDVEILDGNIELSDDNIVTHEYVVGDLMLDGGVTTPEKLMSGGTVTIFNAFNAGVDAEEGNSLVPSFDGKTGKDAAIAFLKRYGARPDFFPAPMVRSPYFEAFLAYQRFMLAWSRQFSSKFTFTFMPELYPGGRVAFPGHGLQMYIESVSHRFDYSSGFTTDAVLSAPSAYGADPLGYSDGLVRASDFEAGTTEVVSASPRTDVSGH